MPEVCEIIMTSHYLLSNIKNKNLSKFEVLAGRYTHQTLEGLKLLQRSLPLKILDISTHGKFMWFTLESDIYIMNTFGLSGEWSFNSGTSDRIKLTITDKSNTFYLYYSDPRNFGTFKITNSFKAIQDKLDGMGPDLLQTEFTEVEFINSVKNNKKIQKKNIITVLMDQTINGVGSGLGNYLAPEILYRSRISPHRKIHSLSDAELKILSKNIKYVLKLCYMHNKVGYMESFGDFIDFHEKGIVKGIFPEFHKSITLDKNDWFTFMVYQQKFDPSGNAVKKDTIVKGRSTYWVPNIQV